MKMTKHLLLIFAAVFLFFGCQKEYSIELANSGILAKGTLKDSLGDCQNFTVAGTYTSDTVLKDANFVLITVNVTSPGKYNITTDASNGFYFKDSGYVGTIGVQTIKLKGYGTPILPIPTSFAVSFDSTNCLFSVTVTGPGGVAGKPATYSLTAAAGACGTPTLQGTYKQGTALTSSNTVTLNVKVDTVGFWNVTTTAVNGIRFTGGGNFTATGTNTILLTGSGTPTVKGPTTIAVTAGSSTCSFNITVDSATTSGGGGSVNDSSAAWSFYQGSKYFHGTFISTSDTTIGGMRFVALFGASAPTGDSALIISLPTTAPGNYPTSSFTAITTFAFSGSNGTIYSADPGTTGAVLTFTVTSYTAATKIITGTFTGNVKNGAGATTPITLGSFKGKLQ